MIRPDHALTAGLCTLFEDARELTSRLAGPFKRGPLDGGIEKFQTDPYRKDHLCSTNTSTATPVRESEQLVQLFGQLEDTARRRDR